MNAPDQWQVTPQAAELYERYPVRYILGPWAPLLVDAARLRRRCALSPAMQTRFLTLSVGLERRRAW